MAEIITPRRSVLYMPGANDKALEKAKTLPCDAIIFDTEDSVAPDMKAVAREKVAAAVRSGEYGRRELTIRINGLDTEWWKADLESAGAAAPSAVVVPKINSAADVALVEGVLDGIDAAANTTIWAMLETPAAMERAVEIATSSDRLTVLIMGTNDLAKELRAALVPGRAPLLWGLGRCLNAARFAGKVILDGVYNDVKNPEGFAAECAQGAEMGFDGKTLIHPTQIEPCNDAFAPSAAEVEHSERVIAAWDEGIAAGKGVITVDGRMIENLHVDNARRALAIAAAIADLES
ncbi:MAG TPA: CoA ester lyase [Microthrixaceae bacterium]|jgi:citrate lyase subunit beta/citryl-CoA lyase|nr:CoA ester lyase [Microthrixaceae bacterium]HQF94852.1 CoA ester lyase [Microthrixaceae bacterium]